MTATPTTQVAIIGGGAMGASTAYYLAKAGIRSTIIERDGIATKASGYNAGGLNPLTGYGLPGPLTDISNVTFRMHNDLAQCLEEESGVPYHHKTIAIVSVAFDDSDLPEMRDTHDAFQAADDRFTSHWLDAADLRNMEPRLNPRCPARPLHPRPLLPQRLRIHPRPRPRSRAQRRADTPHRGNRHRH